MKKTLAEKMRDLELRKEAKMMNPLTSVEKNHWTEIILDKARNGKVRIETDNLGNSLVFLGDTINNMRKEAFFEWLKDEDLYYYETYSAIEIFTLEAIVTESCKKGKHILFNSKTHEMSYDTELFGEENWKYV